MKLTEKEVFWTWFILAIVNIFGLILDIINESLVISIIHSVLIFFSLIAIIGNWKYK